MDRNTFRILEDIQKSKLFDSAALRAVQDFAAKIDFGHINAIYAQHAEQLRRIDELTHGFDFQRIHNQALEAIKRFESIDKQLLTNAQRSLDLFESNRFNVQSILNSPAFAAITDTLSHTAAFEKSFLFDVTEKLRGLAVDVEAEAQEQTITELKDSLIEKAKQLPKGAISFEAMLQIVISLVVLLYAIRTYHSTNESAEIAHQDMQALIQQIEKLPEEVIPNLAHLYQSQADSTWYVVERRCSMFSKQSAKSASIGILYPNQRVQLLERNHKWIYVQYFDFVDGLPRNGWVMKKYLKLVQR